MEKFTKYWFSFFSFALGTAGTIILMSTYVDDRKAFSQTLSDIGAFGSFLGGCATIIAAIAAVIGVNSWINQTKLGPYLTYIWDAKVTLRRINSQKMNWYIYKYQARQASSVSHEGKEQINQLISDCKKQLEIEFSALKNQFDHIDQIVDKKDYLWANRFSQYKRAWKNIDTYLTENPQPEYDETDLKEFLKDNSELVKLNNHFSEGYDFLCSQLDALEEKHTKAL
ncbi:hypothetical protein [Vibrio vulnificus]|nr:hypothetical protein [Vibrio vulnificus]MCJ0812046.1 hypothetical protein [Vibrio vulnificus]